MPRRLRCDYLGPAPAGRFFVASNIRLDCLKKLLRILLIFSIHFHC
jgi:hypothetical protein